MGATTRWANMQVIGEAGNVIKRQKLEELALVRDRCHQLAKIGGLPPKKGAC
jgi:hypothetical protein